MFLRKMPEPSLLAHTLRSFRVTQPNTQRRRGGEHRARNRRVPAGSHAAARCARGASVVDWTSGLALGTVGDAPSGDHEATAAEAAELARLAAEYKASSPRSPACSAATADWSRGRRHGAAQGRGWSSRTSSSATAPLSRPAVRPNHLRQQCVPASVAGPGRQSRTGPHPSAAHGGTAGAGVTTRTRPRRAPDARPTRLADERATGVLSRERGVLYLADGQVVHAESPATPGIDVLLTAAAGCGPTAGARRSPGRARGRVGRFLVDSGRLPGGRAGAVPSGRAVRRRVLRARPEQRPGPVPLRGRALDRPGAAGPTRRRRAGDAAAVATC